ncbi:ABC transporter substrate-binding protein [Nesterenkonia pannonica]|uniref:ABC transporter substrate-binding protein n=1 Tax=Nesterenkonia pannonica TaxID=1548602 RepID=UPI002164D2BC|nr:ABC transporter substrate-binding protein [Nesterenkonia pannonica]
MPITCASPIVNAAAMDIYAHYGLNVTLRRYTGWGELWTAFVAGELDATQLLAPMPWRSITGSPQASGTSVCPTSPTSTATASPSRSGW